VTSSWRVAPARRVAGEVRVPGDKSVSHRGLMLGGLANGVTEIEGFLASEDCLATLAALKALGVSIERPAPTRVRVQGVGLQGLRAPAGPLDMGNAGTAMRLFMGLLAWRPFDSTLVGDSSLMKRPMERAATPLRAMGAVIETQGGKPPVVLRGGHPLHGIDFAMPVASAQVKSAVLLAGLSAEGTTTVTEPAPTRDHTERMLGGFGVQVERRGATVSLRGGQTLTAARVAVPADFSSAAFFLVAGLLGEGPGLTLRQRRHQPDPHRAARDAARDGRRHPRHTARRGRRRTTGRHRSAAERAARHRGRRALVPLAIDEFPVFFVAAACARGVTVVRGADELRVKESDRLAVMSEGLARLGVEHELLADGMRILGRPEGAAFTGGSIDSHGDHRIAMSFAVASLRAGGPIEIGDTANVATSFPGFAALARGRPDAGGALSDDGGAGARHRRALGLGQGHGQPAAGRVLGWQLLDSGALYRLVALAGLRSGLAADDVAGHARLAHALDVSFGARDDGSELVLLGGADVTGPIREESISQGASRVAAWMPVREALLERQRAFATPRVWSPTGATWAPSSSPPRASRST
jgi:cyclohexadieny/prephenate dehydrogenase / 3-phosphoshikimate 1-carboxyvinyltransferase